MPTGSNPDQLYNLMPATYRERDEALGGPLRAVLSIVQEQADLIEGDIQRLWENFFAETCDNWVVPYIGDLVGTTPLFDSNQVQQLDTAGSLFPDLMGATKVLAADALPSSATAGIGFVPQIALRGRADVARTIYYRRRKGTVPMLEQLSRDVTGWGSHVVEFFQILVWSQCVRNHLRMRCTQTPDIRSVEYVGRLNGPFDPISRNVDVRPISQINGWYNIKNIGFYLWRLGSYLIEQVTPRPAASTAGAFFGYSFSPLGNPAPLFTFEQEEGGRYGIATEQTVPGPIRPAAFYKDLADYDNLPLPLPGFTQYYGDVTTNPVSISVYLAGTLVPAVQIHCMGLDTWTQPSGQIVGIDVRNGRLAVGDGYATDQSVTVSYCYGFPADLGGGPYDRQAWHVQPALVQAQLYIDATGKPYVDPLGNVNPTFTTLSAALLSWNPLVDTVITFVSNASVIETVQVDIEPGTGAWLVIDALEGTRPHLELQAGLVICQSVDQPEASVTFSGLLIEGSITVDGSLGRLRLLHTTLVPGISLDPVTGAPQTSNPSILANAERAGQPINETLRVEIAFSITGPIHTPYHSAGLWLLDSIVDGIGGNAIVGPDDQTVPPVLTAKLQLKYPKLPAAIQPAPPVWIERSTILGICVAKEATYVSETIFTDLMIVERQQEGCVRYSFVNIDSSTPKRYACQPDLEIEAEIAQTVAAAGGNPNSVTPAQRQAITARVVSWLVPAFTSLRYGQPAYCQLGLVCPMPIRTGAEDGSEMGAYCHLKQPQREANLRSRLNEYLPFGLDPGIIYVT